MSEIGIDLRFSTNTIVWENAEIPMRKWDQKLIRKEAKRKLT